MMSLGQMPDLLEAGVCDVPYYKVPRGGQTCWRLGLADVRHKTCLWGLKLKGCAGDTFVHRLERSCEPFIFPLTCCLDSRVHDTA